MAYLSLKTCNCWLSMVLIVSEVGLLVIDGNAVEIYLRSMYLNSCTLQLQEENPRLFAFW